MGYIVKALCAWYLLHLVTCYKYHDFGKFASATAARGVVDPDTRSEVHLVQSEVFPVSARCERYFDLKSC
jgi:hypothetical protein